MNIVFILLSKEKGMIFIMQQSNKNIADEKQEILNLIHAGENITIVRKNLGKTIRFLYDPEDEILLINTALLLDFPHV